MRKRAFAITLCLAFAVPLLAAQSAGAATEIGDPCTGNMAEAETPMIGQLQDVSSPLPLVAPAAGVVTMWKVAVIPYPGGVSEQLKVLRPASGPPDAFTVFGESSVQPILGGANTFETRIPIAAGDRIGAFGTGLGGIWCESSNPGDVIGLAKSNFPKGSTSTFEKAAPGGRAAITAVIEPDADGDGFGDETQDKCPQSAALQEPCPVVVLDALSQPPGKGSVRILVTTSTEAAVTVSASATLPKAPKKAKASAVTNLPPLPQLVTPGRVAGYTMNYTAKLKQSLAALPRSKSIKLKIKVEGKAPGGLAPTVKELTVKLKGQRKL